MKNLTELSIEEMEVTEGGSWFGDALRAVASAVYGAADWVYDMTDDLQNNDSRTIGGYIISHL